jgi:hypothetical protein
LQCRILPSARPCKEKMKLRLLLSLLLGTHALTSVAQNNSNWSYWEFNAGLAHFPYETFVFPGCSFLIGRQTSFGKSGFVDQQIGLAFPSIVTGKIGVGSKSEKGSVSTGVRLFPGFAYVQFATKSKQRNFTLSVERALQSRPKGWSFYSDYLLNFGYQWPIGVKKSK